ncbi:MAG: hypothetical protein LBM77_01035 [Spirochaetaceae bacterium]|nr:hypothetical protein [Spirochaetaceae bacterium]
MRTMDEVLKEISGLHGLYNQDGFEKFMELSSIGKETNNKPLHVMAMMNAANIALKMQNFDIWSSLLTEVKNIDENLMLEYLKEPELQATREAFDILFSK